MTMADSDRQRAIEQLRMLPDRARALVMEKARREATRKAIFAGLSAKQREAHDLLHSGTFLSVCAGRRAGKTWWDSREMAAELEQCARDEWVVFLAETAQMGADLVWSEMEALNENHRLGWEMRRHPIPSITTKRGGRFRIVGCDNSSELGKLRGKKYRLVVIDEAKEIEKHLAELVDEIFRPAFINVGGRLVVSGTPGRICDPSDYWYAITHGHAKGWRTVNEWTIRDNPWVRDPERELRMVRDEKGWTVENAIYQREYEGRWVSDEDERVYPYVPGRNSMQGLPEHYDRDTWYHVLGIDYGYSPDPCGWTVWAAHPNERDVYAIHAEKHKELIPDQVAEKTAYLIERYRPSAVVGDGAAKVLIEDFNRRYAEKHKTWIRPASKLGKRDNIEVLGQEMRAPGLVEGKAKAVVCLPMAEDLAEEWLNLGWKDKRREVEHPGHPNHCADSALYGFMEVMAYTHQAAPGPQSDEELLAAKRLAEEDARRRRQTLARSQARTNSFGGMRR